MKRFVPELKLSLRTQLKILRRFSLSLFSSRHSMVSSRFNLTLFRFILFVVSHSSVYIIRTLFTQHHWVCVYWQTRWCFSCAYVRLCEWMCLIVGVFVRIGIYLQWMYSLLSLNVCANVYHWYVRVFGRIIRCFSFDLRYWNYKYNRNRNRNTQAR